MDQTLRESLYLFKLSSNLYRSDMDIDLRLLWTRSPGMLPFLPRNLVLSKSVIVAILLLSSGNVELNPGPPTSIKACKIKPS